ncbi:MAG TPA: hypothetical protein VKE98_18015 [Gemmataceae bacterium]|nr:hypothetical protein [Gemmataceae bacterium]
MSISLTCQCGKAFKVKNKYAGKKFLCDACQQLVLVPSDSVQEASSESLVNLEDAQDSKPEAQENQGTKPTGRPNWLVLGLVAILAFACGWAVGHFFPSNPVEGPPTEGKFAPTGGEFLGRLDGYRMGEIVGWAYKPSRKEDAVTVVIYDGQQALGEVKADQLRKDLADKKIGTGQYGFAFPVPANLRDGQPHEIHAKIKESNFELKNSPRKLVFK